MPPPQPLRGFISYSHTERTQAVRVRDCLRVLNVDSFLAHDDIQVSEQWQARILDELRHMDIFIPLLSKAFRESVWAPQELGYAVARTNVLIIPLSLDGTIPFGFIQHLQGKPLQDAPDEAMFLEALARSYPRVAIATLIQRVSDAPTFRDGEVRVRALQPFFGQLTDQEIDEFMSAAISNNQVWDAARCKRDYLPAFIATYRDNIRPAQLKELQALLAS